MQEDNPGDDREQPEPQAPAGNGAEQDCVAEGLPGRQAGRMKRCELTMLDQEGGCHDLADGEDRHPSKQLHWFERTIAFRKHASDRVTSGAMKAAEVTPPSMPVVVGLSIKETRVEIGPGASGKTMAETHMA